MAAVSGFVARARTALFGVNPVAQQDPTPIRNASPEDDKAPPPVGQNMFTRAYDGFAIGAAWLSALATNDDSILKREGAQDLKLFDALLDDPVVKTAFQQRQLALLSRPWVVEPGDPDDPRSVLAADDLRDMMSAVGWDRVTRLMSFGVWYGYAVAEGLYTMRQHKGRTIVWLDAMIVPDRRWFAFTNAGELRMRSPGSSEGEAVPPNTFWSFKAGATHDFAHYGIGLAHWCYWPVWFKRNVLQFWALYLEKFGQPTVVGYFQPGATAEAIAELVNSLKAIGSDSAVALPAPPSNGNATGAGTDLRPSLMEATRGGGADSYRQFIETEDDALRGVILGQPGTSTGVSGGLGSDQAGMHKDVRDEVIKADSDEIHESFNDTFPKWLTLWNHGPDVAPPTCYRSMDDGEDLTTTAERDSTLDGMGWRRTDDSFRETYGDGYERKPEPTVVTDPRLAIGANGGLPLAANDDDRAQAVANFAANDDPAPLYVSRRLLNAAELIRWAKSQGFTVTEKADDLHVTVLYSKTPVDWFAMAGEGWDWGKVEIEEGGPRAVVQFGEGEGGAIVLRFASPILRYRHDSMIERGASSDFPDYKPHVTFTYDGSGVDLSKVEPFTGALRFGPEIFERIAPPAPADGMPTFSAEALDAIDAMTDELVRETDPTFAAMGEAVRERLAAFTADGRQLTVEGFRIALLQAAEKFPIADLAARLALPLAAERAAAAIGAEDQVGV